MRSLLRRSQLSCKLSFQSENICVSSYNSTGFGLSARNFIKVLLSFSEILLIQEHFLLDANDKKHSNTDILRSCFGPSFDMFITPAFKDTSQVSRGRGKGGLVTVWRQELSKYVS